MSMNQLRLLAFGALGLYVAGAVAAKESNETSPRYAIPRIDRLALFKNGLGYATAMAKLPDHAGRVRLGQLPVPCYGTFWLAYPKTVKVRSLVTAMETVDETATASSLDQLLRLNPGRKVLIHTAAAPGVAEVVLEGVVKPTVQPEALEPPSPYFMDIRRPVDHGYPYGYPPPSPNGVVLLQTDKGLVALSPGSIQRVDFAVGEPVCVTTNQQKRPAIRMELEEPAAGENVEVSFLARGITWVPSYRIDLSDEKTARFSAQAQIINELADLQDAHVDLVTGFPYTWKIGDHLDGDPARLRGDGRSAEEVWHTCRLVNAARMPLTTAAAEFVKDGQFVGQDTCFYTAAGAEASIRINRAMNVQADEAEIEIERKRNAANFYGYGYDLVKLTGELKARNRLDKPINLEITKELSGEVLDKSDSAQDVQTARGLKQVNPKHVLTWTLELKPAEERKITYSYQLYVRP